MLRHIVLYCTYVVSKLSSTSCYASSSYVMVYTTIFAEEQTLLLSPIITLQTHKYMDFSFHTQYKLPAVLHNGMVIKKNKITAHYKKCFHIFYTQYNEYISAYK